ncbi:hypothetical protein BD310DRAFT_265554 [Dichomitus squalens]|uniref:Uncharacterized protein n=1 Tax=Dichomitus squalens TaxID=114155 RepID=A0A4Q9Q0S8_9APHY|nr:hypothetical protein BD310DRAFT_265554 [Dichomitus squalens]
MTPPTVLMVQKERTVSFCPHLLIVTTHTLLHSKVFVPRQNSAYQRASKSVYWIAPNLRSLEPVYLAFSFICVAPFPISCMLTISGREPRGQNLIWHSTLRSRCGVRRFRGSMLLSVRPEEAPMDVHSTSTLLRLAKQSTVDLRAGSHSLPVTSS